MEIFVAIAATSPLNSSTDEHSLLAIKSHIIASDPNNTLASNWSTGTDFCTWIGITCSRKHPRVTELDLYNMGLQGTIAKEIGNLSFLTMLILANNNLSGSIPSSLGDLTKLELFDLSYNRLSGKIPLSLGQLSNLEYVDIYHSSLDGTVFEDHFANLSKLSTLVVSSLKFKLRLDWVPPFQLRQLSLVSCDIGGQFPQWVQMQKELEYLQIGNCSISDTLSNSLYNSKNLTACFMFNGSLPDSLCEIKSLQVMDLSKNHLSGNIPGCLGNLQGLEFMKLSSNEISGVVPNSIGGAYSLEWLHLNNNNLTGKLPYTMKNCTKLKVVDIGDNMFSGNLPKWIGNHLLDLRVLRLRNNKFHGQIPLEVCQLLKLQMLDLANNNLTGGIPNCFSNFSGMVVNPKSNNEHFPTNYGGYWNAESFTEVLKGQEREYSDKISRLLVNLDVSNNILVGEIPWELTRLSGLHGLNLSHNHLVGKILEKIGDMKSMESLDLSDNNLSGTIPSSLSDLSSISRLNLSYNNLSGKVSTGRQLQTLDYPSIYEGNPQLCGAPLPKKCEEASMVPSITDNHVAANEGDNIIDDKVLLSIVIISGIATRFWGVIGVLVFNKRCRQAYFEFAEERIIRRLFGVRRHSPIVTSTKKDDKNKTHNSLPIITQPPHYRSELQSGPVSHPGTVPFQWEHTPGISKEETKPTTPNLNRPPIAPGLPPGRYPKSSIVNLPHEASSSETSESGDSDEAYVDALDTLSRTESYFLNCSMSGLSGMDMEPYRSFATDPKTREFMMDRFLPAAMAMVSDTTQYAPKKQQSQEVKKIVVHMDKPSLRYGPGFAKRYSHFQEEERKEESDEEYDQHGNMPSVCGLLPRFCFLNPVPAMSVRTRVRISSGNKIQPRSSSSGSYTENEWKSDITDIQSVDKIPEAELKENKSILRNESSQIESHNTSTHCGYGSNGKDLKFFKELLTDQESQNEIDSRSRVVEKILYVDTIHDSREEGNDIMMKRMNEVEAIDSASEDIKKFVSVDEEAKMLSNSHGFRIVSSIDNSNEKRGIETQRENRDHFDLDSTTTEKSHQKYSHQFPVPPPLPKSPSDSWLSRTLPKNVALRSYRGSSTNPQNKFPKASTVL
ncbi:hypothetical protein RD792_006390 [Penstemon davidsonii]|uniref:Leucine-rich repeat-containing N-terminal plant-type domain-containing protein n=1 Tax=Penstemon davidsonii TaxID=160366 RepID=A0ABR0DDM6_9LAMI|nr:hypothetical protein RD792_006390 [Penstemon davidsonii]